MGLLILGLLADFAVKPPPSPPLTVQVSLRPQKALPRLPPLPLPQFSQQPQIVAIQPRITITQPPPPDAVYAVSPARAPAAPEATQGPAKPAPPPMDYLSRLEAHLNAYKNYPYDARIHREEGIVQLRFSLDRSGHVLSYAVVGKLRLCLTRCRSARHDTPRRSLPTGTGELSWRHAGTCRAASIRAALTQCWQTRWRMMYRSVFAPRRETRISGCRAERAGRRMPVGMVPLRILYSPRTFLALGKAARFFERQSRAPLDALGIPLQG